MIMRKKKYWQSLTAMTMCSILICHAPIVHAADQNIIAQDIEKETAIQGETDIDVDNNTSNVPTDETDIINEIDKVNEANKIDETNHANETDKINNLDTINEKDKVSGTDITNEKAAMDNTDDMEDTDVSNGRELTASKTGNVTLIPDTVDYMCRDDIMFKFNNGIGDKALEKITEVVFFPYENVSEDQKRDAIGTLDYEDDCFAYDMEKGEFIIKNEALKESAMIPGESYYVEIRGNMVDGTPFKFEKSKEWIINYIDSSKFDLKEENDVNEEEHDYEQEKLEQIDLFSHEIAANDPSDEQHVLNLTNVNTALSAAEMEELIEINQTKDVVIHTNDGVTFTFLKNTMKMVDGKESYNFGVELISDCQQAGVEMSNEDFVFRIKYYNTGELPGTAQVSIPVGSQWAGQEVFYAAMDDRGILYMSNEVVDVNGTYTIPDLWFTL